MGAAAETLPKRGVRALSDALPGRLGCGRRELLDHSAGYSFTIPYSTTLQVERSQSQLEWEAARNRDLQAKLDARNASLEKHKEKYKKSMPKRMLTQDEAAIKIQNIQRGRE